MKNHKIRIRVEIVECEEENNGKAEKVNDGEFEMIVTGQQAVSIDDIEQAVLATNYPAIRDALSKHLSEISKKKAKEQGKEQGRKVEIIANEHEYQVDGEVGRFTFASYSTVNEQEITYNTSIDLFPELIGKQWYTTRGFKELAFIYGDVEESYRKTADLINRIRHQPNATPQRTLQERTVAEGIKLAAFMEEKTEKILRAKGFSEDKPEEEIKEIKKEIAKEYGAKKLYLERVDKVSKVLEACSKTKEELKEMSNNPVAYERGSRSVNATIDDVNVHKQKESRESESNKGEREDETEQSKSGKKYVHNTVVHVEKGGKKYLFNATNTVLALKMLMAFLFTNQLLRNNLIFFVDGQKTLYAAILKAFSCFRAMQMILDWYHLEEKCRQLLSMALKGKNVRKEVLDKLMPLLWNGRVDSAIDYLLSLNATFVRRKGYIKKLVEYLERHKPHIPCYSVREKLGLRNSSNVGEKQNDLVVSHRQKHNGTSWSKSGSLALASLTTLKRNKETARWFKSSDIKFKLAA